METDATIQKNVIEELKWEPILNATEIGVAVKNGIVTLTGRVSTYAKKSAAERAVWRVKGVHGVAEELHVSLVDENTPTDSEIADKVVDTLRWHTSIPDDQIKVTVTNGWLKLEGEVNWNFQKEAVFNAVKHLAGVTNIKNFIKVKPRINTAIIRAGIRKALERNADLDADKISVETSNNKVVLKGTAYSWNERTAAARAAWSAPGVEWV